MMIPFSFVKLLIYISTIFVSFCIVFKRITDLKVNLKKGTMAWLNISKEELNPYAIGLGCETTQWPLKYLGLPLEGNPIALKFWSPIVKKKRTKD